MFFEQILKRKELVRGIWHVLSISGAAIIFHLADSSALLGLIVFGLVFLAFDYGRARNVRWMKAVIRAFTGQLFFNALREKERNHLSTSSHFIYAGLIIVSLYLFCGLPKFIMIAAAMFLAVGDPMARLIGKEWKETGFNGLVDSATREMLTFGRKTMIGSISFFFFGLLSAVVFCNLAGYIVPWNVIASGCLVATLVEFWCVNWDNFFVPLCSVLSMWALAQSI